MNEKLIKKILLWAAALFLFLFSVTPWIYMLITSLSQQPDFLTATVPFRFTLKNYSRVLTEPSLHFFQYLWNSLFVSSLSAVICVLVASVAAYGFTRFRTGASKAILFGILTCSMFPQISLVNFLFKTMTELHWINTHAALILPYVAWVLPLTLWILVSYFAEIPRDLDHAAAVDGCSPAQTLFKIIYPVAMPGILSAGLLAFIAAFNEFLFALMLTTDYRGRTVPVGIAMFEGLHGQIPWGQIMAASMMATLPVILLTLFFQKRILQGLTGGAVKE